MRAGRPPAPPAATLAAALLTPADDVDLLGPLWATAGAELWQRYTCVCGKRLPTWAAFVAHRAEHHTAARPRPEQPAA